MARITYEYYTGERHTPPMSPVLARYIRRATEALGVTEMHIVDIGTVGDKNHKPTSFHKCEPPRAIDVLKVYLKWADGKAVTIDMRNLDQRAFAADFWESLGGETRHKRSHMHQHLHCQTVTRGGDI